MLLSLIACAVGGGELALTLDEPVHTASVTLENGELHVEDDSDVIELWWEGGGVAEDQLVDYGVEDGVFWFDAGCTVTCGGELSLRVPPGTELHLCLDRGEVDARLQEPATVEALLDTGELSLEVPEGAYALDLEMAVGELSTHGVEDSPDAEHRLRGHVAVGELSVRGVDYSSM